jgi:hypothetical protein
MQRRSRSYLKKFLKDDGLTFNNNGNDTRTKEDCLYERTLFDAICTLFEEKKEDFSDTFNTSIINPVQRKEQLRLICQWLSHEIKNDSDWLKPKDDKGRPTNLSRHSIAEYEARAIQAGFPTKIHPLVKTKSTRLYLTVQAPKEEEEKIWQKFSDTTQEDFYQHRTAGLPEGTEIKLSLNADGHLNQITYDYEGRDGNFHFNRIFDEQTKTVFHAGAYCKGKIKKTGINKIIQAHMFAFYEDREFEKVEISAGNIGCFAWARLGFKPTQESWEKIRAPLKRRLEFLEAYPCPESGPLNNFTAAFIRIHGISACEF